jgi:uncharacterized membrane protein
MPSQPDIFPPTTFYLSIRYLSIALVALLFVSAYLTQKAQFMETDKSLKPIIEISLFGSIIWILSSELLHWMSIYDAKHAYKLGLSILWGSYSLLMIILGISKNKASLRYMAIILFAVTLVKLFVYDISHISLLYKTIIFVALGLILLIISFLYTKYKHLIFDDDDKKEEIE